MTLFSTTETLVGSARGTGLDWGVCWVLASNDYSTSVGSAGLASQNSYKIYDPPYHNGNTCWEC